MDFELMFCPYCGGDTDRSDDSAFICKACGKSIYTDREGIRHFLRPGELRNSFEDALDAIEDDNGKKAIDISNEMLEASDDADFDAFFLRGAAYACIGEDGKAAMDWKRGLELLSTYTNIDAYVCLMAESIAKMIYFKEREYIDFDVLKYIDRLCEEADACTGESCKAFFYHTIFMDYRSLMGRAEGSGEETFNDIVPLLFKRIVEYHRNPLCLIRTIDEYLVSVGYNPETYDDDDMNEFHVYDLISADLKAHTADMSADSIRAVMTTWSDESLKANEARLEEILDHQKGTGVIGKILARRAGTDEEPVSEPDAVDVYVRSYLLLDPPASESQEPAVLE